MITPEMTAAEIHREVKKDMPSVLHALHKGYGGKRGYESDKQQMANEVLRQPEGTILLGNVETYTSGKTGNHWVIYSYALNAGFNTATTGHREFIWMDEPDGSISAMQFADPSRDAGWSPIHYSGHFFQRYAEREHLGEVDLQLVIDFMRQNANGVFQADFEQKSPGKYRFDVILRNGIGRGYTTGLEPGNDKQMFVSHVRTYLPHHMLNPVQRRETADARAMQASKSRPADTFVNMIVANELTALTDYFEDFFIARGLPASSGRMFSNLMVQIITNEVIATTPPETKPNESDLRALLLRLYHRYQQNVFEYVALHPSKTGYYSVLDAIIVAKSTNHDLDIRAMLTAMLDPKPDDHRLIGYIERTAAKLEAKSKEGIATGIIKA